MSISIKISMESYFESLNENDKLAFRKKLMLESSKTSTPTQSQKWLDWRCWCSSAKMWCVTSYRIFVLIQRESWKLINHLEHMIILCAVMFKSVTTILLKKYFALLNHKFFQVRGRVIQAICTYYVWVCIHKKHGCTLTANCWCIAGLGLACSHVADLFFKIEKTIHDTWNRWHFSNQYSLSMEVNKEVSRNNPNSTDKFQQSEERWFTFCAFIDMFLC